MIVTKNKQTNKQTIKSKEHVHTICSIHKFEEEKKEEAEVEEARTTISIEYDEFISFYYFHFS